MESAGAHETSGWIPFWNWVLLANLVWTVGWTALLLRELGSCTSDGSECEMAGFVPAILLMLGEAVLAIPSLVGFVVLCVHAVDRDLVFEDFGWNLRSPLWGMIAGCITIVIWIILFTSL